MVAAPRVLGMGPSNKLPLKSRLDNVSVRPHDVGKLPVSLLFCRLRADPGVEKLEHKLDGTWPASELSLRFKTLRRVSLLIASGMVPAGARLVEYS